MGSNDKHLLPIGTCRRIITTAQQSRCGIAAAADDDDENDDDDDRTNNVFLNSSTDTDTGTSIIPPGCHYVLIYQPIVNDDDDTDIDDIANQHPSTSSTRSNCYLCRILDLNGTSTGTGIRTSNQSFTKDDNDDNSIQRIDRTGSNDTASTFTGGYKTTVDSSSMVEIFECSLNITIGIPVVIGNDTGTSIDVWNSESHCELLQWDFMYPIINIPSHHTIQRIRNVILHVDAKKITKDQIMACTDDSMKMTPYLIPIKSIVNHPPIPILSIFMPYTCTSILMESSTWNTGSTGTNVDRKNVTLQNQPLLQSCLKKQLVGSHVGIWSDDQSSNTNDSTGGSSIHKTTHIRFTFDQYRWKFLIGSITTTIKTNMNSLHHVDDNHFKIGVILPSTRITFIHPIVYPTLKTTMYDVPVADNQTKCHSPAVRILLDTVYCIGQIQNMTHSLSSSSLPLLLPVPFGDIPRTFLLSGPPGIGKTHAIRYVVQHATEMGIHCNLIVLQGSEILSIGHFADAAKVLERHFVDAIEKMNDTTKTISIIFLDECDALLASSNESSMLIESTLGRLLDEMYMYKRSNDAVYMGLIVVAATNRVDTIPSSLRRPGRFDREIPMLPPDAEMRMKILQSLIMSSNVINTEEDQITANDVRDIADACVGFVPADLAAIVRRVELLRIMQIKDTLDTKNGTNMLVVNTQTSHINLWASAISDIGASTLRDTAIKAPPATSWDDVAGDPGGAKTALRQAIQWPRIKHDAYKLLGLVAPRGILLHGPPGCAKTTLARAAANTSAVSFVSLSPADVYSTSYVGDAEAVIRRAFTLARSASPCVLFFDEIDAILGMNENNANHGMGRGSAVEARVLSTFLNEMDGVDGSWKDGVLVLGATNRPWSLDTALLRPGRFDKIIYVPPPDCEGRREILSMHCQHWTKGSGIATITSLPPIDVDFLASDSISGNMTGAEIVGACREAAMLCFREATANVSANNPRLDQLIMKEEYLITALRNVQPLLSNPTIMDEFLSFQQHRTRNVQ
jgi:SpoVK/Ycf46/Vps4 family AAA+-type ATPase